MLLVGCVVERALVCCVGLVLLCYVLVLFCCIYKCAAAVSVCWRGVVSLFCWFVDLSRCSFVDVLLWWRAVAWLSCCCVASLFCRGVASLCCCGDVVLMLFC